MSTYSKHSSIGADKRERERERERVRGSSLLVTLLLTFLIALCLSVTSTQRADAVELTEADIQSLSPSVAALSSPTTTYASSSIVPSSAYNELGSIIYYDNFLTYTHTLGDEYSYCVNPSLVPPADGTYTTSSPATPTDSYANSSWNIERIRMILYYGYGGPGFDKNADWWPDTWYDGTALTNNDYYVITHIALSFCWTRSTADATYGCSDSFENYVRQYITGIEDGEVKYSSAFVQSVYNNGQDDMPGTDVFQSYAINTGSTATQTLISFAYNPTGYLSLTKASGNSDVTDDNSMYSLKGAQYGIYTSSSCTSSSLVTTVTTTASGSTSTVELDAGTYYVKEISASTNYELDDTVYTVTINGGETTSKAVEETPITVSPTVSYKYDTETETLVAQGDATLAGAQFTVSYYDVSTAEEAESATPVRTWVFETDEDGNICIDAEHYVSGDALYYDSSGNVVLPVGVISYQETTAPEGYLLNDEITWIVLSDDSADTSVSTYDDVIRGGVSVQKFAAEVSQSTTGTSANGVYTGADLASVLGLNDDGTVLSVEDITVILENAASTMNITNFSASVIGADSSGITTENATDYYAVPQAGAKFEGAVITIYNASEAAVIVDGVTYEPGEAVLTLTLDETGYAATAADALPYGTYTLKETAAPTGYKRNSDWERTIEIREDGVIVEVTDLPEDDTNTAGVDDQVIRGDYKFNKIALDTQESLAYVPFLLINNETGEAHVIVTDVNGEFYSESDWNAHTYNTNANDAAITWNDDGTYTIDATLLDEYAGVWFTGYGPLNDPTGELAQMVDPNDDLGALPYGTYTLIELSSESNATYSGIVRTFSITRDGMVVNGGTITDSLTEVEIGTVAVDGTTQTHVGNAMSTDTVTIIDTVTYDGLSAGTTYTMTGTLYDKATGEEIEGTETSIEFTPESSSGTVELTFVVSAELVLGKSVVAFEDCYYGDVLLGSHADIEDEEQTVSYPEISTNAVDGVTYEHEGDATSTDTVTVVDTVTYVGLVPGETYTMTGTLYDKETGEAIEGITASVEFTPAASSGTVEITFEVLADLVLGKHVVVFEECYYEEQLVAIHADINDEEQTVAYPEINTTASDASDGDQTVTSSTSSVIVDRVDYVGLTPGVEYTLIGTLYDQETGVVVTGVDPVTLTFTPETSDGYVEMTFTLDTTALVDHTLVVFERLYHDFNEDGLLDDVTEVVSTHEDINAESQSVFIADGNVADELLAQTGNSLRAISIVAGITALVGAAVYGIRRQRRYAIK